MRYVADIVGYYNDVEGTIQNGDEEHKNEKFLDALRHAVEAICYVIIDKYLPLVSTNHEFSEIESGKVIIEFNNTTKLYQFKRAPCQKKPCSEIIRYAEGLITMYNNVHDASNSELFKNIRRQFSELNNVYSFSNPGAHAPGKVKKYNARLRVDKVKMDFCHFIDFLDKYKILPDSEIQLRDILTSFDDFKKKYAELKEVVESLEKENKALKAQFNFRNLDDPTILTDVPEDSLDDFQDDLLTEAIEIAEESNVGAKGVLIAGSAGSGKSIIAMYLASNLAGEGKNVSFVSFTNTLNDYIKTGNTAGNSFRNHIFSEWRNLSDDIKKIDYLIVDEIQDYSEPQIRQFMECANKRFFFFGDSNQSIYTKTLWPANPDVEEKTCSMEQISGITGLSVRKLRANYRLPKGVARLAHDYVGREIEGMERYHGNEGNFKNTEQSLPYILECTSDEEQLELISKILSDCQNQTVGILLPKNDMVLEIVSFLIEEKNIPCEYKYRIKGQDRKEDKYSYTLDFRTTYPKIMTYHSSKGLQFDVVIIPFFTEARNEQDCKKLYVAMTRTKHRLYILHSEGQLGVPFNDVEQRFYNNAL